MTGTVQGLVAAFLMLGMLACEGFPEAPPPPATLAEGRQESGPGAWDVVRDALRAAAKDRELAVFAIEASEGGITAQLRNARSEPILLVIERGGEGKGEEEITARALVGRFGDPEAEIGLLQSFFRELKRKTARQEARGK